MFILITIITRALVALVLAVVCSAIIGMFNELITAVLCIALFIGSMYVFEWLFCAAAEYFGQDVSGHVGYCPHGKRFKKKRR